tara:strand:- start:1462 stop:1935 length:474 start_codon:yes stop_codon:yes gene_type:complete
MIGSTHVLPTYNMQKFHFIGITRGGYATITDPEGKPRMICFSKRETARKCISYISEYRSTYGVWPDTNLQVPVARINPDPLAKKRTPEEIKKYIYLEEKVKSQLNEMSAGTGLCYFYCHTFDYKDDLLRITMSGQKIEGEADDGYYKSRLNIRLKIV